MKNWTYKGREKRPVLSDPEAPRSEDLDEVMRRIVGSVPKQLGPASVEFHVIESPRAYDAGEIGIDMDRLAGILQADILVEKNRGEGAASRLADFIAFALRKRQTDGIRFGETHIGEGHNFKDNKWRVQVTCPWHVDILSTRN